VSGYNLQAFRCWAFHGVAVAEPVDACLLVNRRDHCLHQHH
jgi:hypothetical protein